MKVAVAGLGWWGKEIVRCLHASPRFEVVCGIDAFASPGTGEFLTALGIAFRDDLDGALRDPQVDGIVLATPHALHEEQALKVLDAGKDLFCEKPLAMTAAGAENILADARRRGKVVGIGHERRYEPAFEELQRIVGGGELGRLLFIDANVSHDLFRRLDRANWRLSGTHAPAGMMTAIGIHLTDLFVHLAGPAAEVRARTASLVFEPPAEDFVAAGIVFRSGARAAVTALSSTPYYGRFTVFGDKGWVEVVSEANVDQGKPTIMTRTDGAGRSTRTYQAVDTVRANFEAWADAVAGHAPYRFTDDELLENIRIFEAIVTSARRDGAAIAL
jgi:predicted dehydrogenase